VKLLFCLQHVFHMQPLDFLHCNPASIYKHTYPKSKTKIFFIDLKHIPYSNEKIIYIFRRYHINVLGF